MPTPTAASRPETITVTTPHGPAQVQLSPGDRGLLILGPGASGSVTAGDLAVALRVAGERGMATAMVTPPYAVAGKRVPPRGPVADEDWTAVVTAVRERFPDGPLVTGGRSFGARVACHTAAAVGADAVLCLAFPTHPPGKPEKTRQPELDAVTVPVLVVTGASDPFGNPTGSATTRVEVVPGDHGLKKDLPGIGALIGSWLDQLLG